MKKLILMAFGVLAGYSVLAQGTIQFQNATTATSAYNTNTIAQGGTRGKVVNTTSNYMAYALFFAPGSGPSNNLQFATSVYNAIAPAGAGVISGNTLLALPGVAAGETAWVMVLAYDGALGLNGYTHYIGPYGSGTPGKMNGQWDGAGQWFSQSPTILVALGPASGPGSVMYGSTVGSQIGSVGGATDIFPVPEPSLFTLAGLGAAGMMIFRRRR
jgi:hypothetical protein